MGVQEAAGRGQKEEKQRVGKRATNPLQQLRTYVAFPFGARSRGGWRLELRQRFLGRSLQVDARLKGVSLLLHALWLRTILIRPPCHVAIGSVVCPEAVSRVANVLASSLRCLASLAAHQSTVHLEHLVNSAVLL